MQRTFHFYSDPAHGWLRVNKRVLRNYWGNLWRQSFTPYSYELGDWVYLEEDQDAHVFLTGLKDAGVEYRINRRPQANTYSRIRNYQHLQPIGD